jgi:hypothetical protein
MMESPFVTTGSKDVATAVAEHTAGMWAPWWA